jgi:hypothetical protein
MIAGIICALLPHHRGKAHVMQKIVLALLLAASLSVAVIFCVFTRPISTKAMSSQKKWSIA